MEDLQTIISAATEVELDTAKEPSIVVYESILDLLFVEEFYSSPAFAQWFGEQLTKDKLTPVENFKPPRQYKEHKLNPAKFSEVNHSVTAIEGETDILVIYKTADGLPWLVLIENKINANFQKRQVERYYIRAENLVKEKKAAGFTIVLIAPSRYFANVPDKFGFEATISYESVKEWFSQKSNLGERAKYKAALLKTAIEKKEKNPGDPKVNIFCRAYDRFLQTVQTEFKDVVLKSNLQASRNDTWIGYKLPVGKAEIVHKATEGQVGLYLSGKAANLTEIRQRYATWLETTPSLAIRPAGKSVALTLVVPKLSIETDFAEQHENVRKAFQAITQLVEIYRAERKNRSKAAKS